MEINLFKFEVRIWNTRMPCGSKNCNSNQFNRISRIYQNYTSSSFYIILKLSTTIKASYDLTQELWYMETILKTETPVQKNVCTPLFISALFTMAKCWKQPKCPSVNEWIQKLGYIYTMEYYTVERKKELLPFSTSWMELESIMPSEICQVVKDKYHVISPIHGT